MDFTAMILKALLGAAFDMNTYIGVAVGALLAPMWISVYKLLKAVVVSKVPFASFIFGKLESSVDEIEHRIEPVADAIKDKADKVGK